jgi:hypothetical protein
MKSLCVIFLALAGACANGGGSVPDAFFIGNHADASTNNRADARSNQRFDANTTGGGADAAPGGCVAAASYPDSLMNQQGAAFFDMTTGKLGEQELLGALTTTAMPDLLDIQLYPSGDLASGIAAGGPFTIDATESQYQTCGTCIIIKAGATIDSTGHITGEAASYLAESGSITLSSVADATAGTGTISGTLTNVVLQQVTIDSTYKSTPVVPACTTTIASLTFSGTSSKFTCDATTGMCTPG